MRYHRYYNRTVERALSSGSSAAELRVRDAVIELLDMVFPRARPDTRRLLATRAELRAFVPRQTVTAQGDDLVGGLVVERNGRDRLRLLDATRLAQTAAGPPRSR